MAVSGQHTGHQSGGGIAGSSVWERDERWMWQLPGHVLRSLELDSGMTVGDVGCGEGYFTFLLAPQVGDAGKVYASDIDREALENLRASAGKNTHGNIVVIQGTPGDPCLPDKVIDLALLVNVTHLLDNQALFFENLEKSLRPGGRLVIVQWDAGKLNIENPWTPGPEFSEDTLLSNLEMAGFRLQRTEDYLPLQRIYHLARK
ncbi:MAG: class I SAM-dependent methyltransferase [Bacteroidales bacterium]|nr:class I SAM-dependent methyltransferase [Bacteroidales bacterium]